MADGRLSPIHFRDLGHKDGYLYSKKVSWVDATINNVPLEQTFRYEDEIEYIKNVSDVTTNGYIIVNERVTQPIKADIDLPVIHQKKKWLNRLDKLTLQPMTLPQAKKKKKGPQRFPVKPRTAAQKETEHHSSDKFLELVDTKSPGILGEFLYTIRCRHGYEKNITYCPPEHWLTPVVLWKNIWTEMDEIEHGYKRDYVYVSDGEVCPDSPSIKGPAIYFFETYCETVEDYEKHWLRANKYWITGSRDETKNTHTSWLEIKDCQRLSDTSYLSRVEKAYLNNPNNVTFHDYQDGWLLTQPGYKAYYQGGVGEWIFKVHPSDHNINRLEYIPQPHL